MTIDAHLEPAPALLPPDAHADGRSPGKRARTDGLGPSLDRLADRVAGVLQRRALAGAGDRDDNGVAADAEPVVARAATSSGAPLPGHLQRQFEGSLGTDLSAVRVHTGDTSAAAAHAVGAKAYTVGQDIHFGAGRYQPDDPFGMHLLAHEVAHTVQQAGGPARRQHKLEVSAPHDAAEREADLAADAMVRGTAATVGDAVRAVHRLAARTVDPGYGQLQGAGDEARTAALRLPLSVDTASVQVDAHRADELIGEIDRNTPVIKQAERAHPDAEERFGYLAANTATRANLEIFKDKLGVAGVDTSGFAAQYRLSFGDFQRIKATASELLTAHGIHGDDPIATVGDGFAKLDLSIGEGQVGLSRFRAARNNLHTASKKMNAQLTTCRGAGNLLQGALYKAKSAAAAATGAAAASQLTEVRAEIDATAANVGKVLKLASAVSGFAAGGGATNALATPRDTGGHVDIEPGILSPGGTILVDEPRASKKDLALAMGTDLMSLVTDPTQLAVELVKAFGTYANRDKISHLQQTIAQAAAAEATFKAAGDASNFLGYHEQFEGAAKQLGNLLEAFSDATTELATARDLLMAELAKHGGAKGHGKGADQAKGVLFLGDADRFLAQVTNAIAVGENQQQNLQSAAADRKALRGTVGTTEAGPDRRSQAFYRCHKTTTAGALWGTNDQFKFERVFVTFQDTGRFGRDDVNQGGAGSIEGTGGADDVVKRKLDVLRQAQTQVKQLQAKVQTALGVGPAIMNA